MMTLFTALRGMNSSAFHMTSRLRVSIATIQPKAGRFPSWVLSNLLIIT
jgi:hypothetical protein